MLTPIREDLNLLPSSISSHGYPIWTIHDPVRNKFFQIEWRVFEVLRHWKKGSAKLVARAVNSETVLEIDESFINGIEKFFLSNQLCKASDNLSIKNLVEDKKILKSSRFKWLLRHYLFFRIPIFKCDEFLTTAFPYIRFMYSRWFIGLSVICLFVGLFLISHQWDVFAGQILDYFSFKGLFLFFITLVFVKISHEFGHAFTAKKYGCKVPVMGVAFLVLWPMFYTDTNESWKLKLASQRFNVARAGIVAELLIASFATLAWSLLPSGSLREMVFIMATITWVSSLAINASPFMRFDGYYLLSDYWNIPNLHERSGNLARWWLREKLFNLQEKKPEYFPKRRELLLISFAFSTWIYRLILFIGIALLVYNFFFKILGVFLFATEIIWFVIRPIWLEAREWRLRKDIIFMKARVWIVILVLFTILCCLFIPWRGTIVLDAVIHGVPYKNIFVKTGGRLQELNATESRLVKQGELIVKFKNPNLESKLQQIENKIEVQNTIFHLSSFDDLSWKRNGIIAAEIARLETEKIALDNLIDSLNIYAPITGNITDITRGLFVGQWLAGGQKLFSIKGDDGFNITAYLNEEDVSRIDKDGTCGFKILHRGFDNYSCILGDVRETSETNIDEKMLSAFYGGNILTTNVQGDLIPSKAVYKLTAEIKSTELPVNHKTKGLIVVSAKKINMIDRFWRWFVSIIIREVGM